MQLLRFISLCGLLAVMSKVSLAQNTEFRPGVGLYEGVNAQGWLFEQLQINEQPPHALVRFSIVDAFTSGSVVEFSEEQLQCSASECILDVVNPNWSDSRIRLIITPQFDQGLRVLDITTHQEGKALSSNSYLLLKQAGESTVKRFTEQHIAFYKQFFEHNVRTDEAQDGHYGPWLGILEQDEKRDLVFLEFNKTGRSRFMRYVTGTAYTDEAFFEAGKINEAGNILFIRTSHNVFANKVLLHRNSASMINGYLFSELQGNLVQPSTFKLRRFEPRPPGNARFIIRQQGE